ncbi:laminin subunit gamma-1 isoform X2 [Agrilus planipennis]|uniref:Laminin subunit gamma-1 isoform X2 n=1 Tax=Agrilus planipennis TaxID=224129 RepID=A0A1W4WF81_AGRPL|nr:laminin subunit gamma-1 isoform X2 [Agrilus planipennis]
MRPYTMKSIIAVLVLLSLLVSENFVTDCAKWDGLTPWFSDSTCNCNGFSTRCFFDKELYESTGHGGHCLDCAANRDGPHCERCRENYFTREDGYCIACDCDPIGSRNLQCNSQGRCQCKPGVTGDKCNRCDVNYFEFGTHGCKHCGCSEEGSLSNTPDCDPISGACRCKENVEGKRCRECKPGYFNLDLENEFGCTPCFCYGHSSECAPAPGYSRYQIESIFSKSTEKWRAEDEKGRPIEIHYDGLTQRIGVSAPPDDAVYFLAPERFLGNQKASYNQLLQFTLSIGENRPVPTATDIILEGAGSYVTNTIFAQRNPIPAVQKQHYKFRLHEHPNYGWQPRLSARNFMSVLSNLTAIRIKGTYTSGGVGFLDDVKLETASRGVAGRPALWVEMCQCPDGYVGQFCESCAPGYRHSPSHGGPFSPCIPCDCNKHADICDSETGLCICQHNTAGDNCDRCARGYYGNALTGTPYDCQPCGCPEGGACIQLTEDIIMCIECPTGYTGHRCDSCSDGYFGDPTGRYGPAQPCQPCECNLNIDTNAVGNCNTTTGECLKCIHNTGGTHCDQCLPGYHGDALALPKGDCEPCQCYSAGTEERPDGISECDQISGECRCKSHVKGRNCDQCEDGYYNIVSGEGCQQCNCNPIGSLNHTCDLYTGQCHCREGITGLRCDRCEDYKYGFSSEGCKACECDLIGSRGPQCDMFGQCPCLDNVEGRKCDRCKENKYDRKRGCVDCPDCYNLVQNASRNHLAKLARLAEILDEIERNPTVINDDLFEKQLRAIQDEIEDLLDQARTGTGGDEENLTEKLNNIEERQKAISRTLSEIKENTQLALDMGEIAKSNVSYTEDSISLAKKDLEEASDILQTQGKNALENAQKRAREFGQQSDKMTSIAQEARKTADDLDEYAEVIVKTAADAKNKSIEAYDLAKNATDLQRNINQDVKRLRNDVDETEARLNRIKNWTEDTQNKAIEAKKDALSLLNVVYNYVIPAIDIPALKSQAEDVKKEAERLSNETEKLQQQNDDLLNDINEQVIFAEDLLQKGIEQQDTTNDLLSEIDLAKAQAESAVTLGDETLKEATATYETLSHFDKQVKESKAAAKQAIQQIPEIQQLIDEASDKANEAENSLKDAKFNADNALRTVTQADSLAKAASEKAQQIKAEAEQLYQNATGFKQEANLMADRVDNTDMEYQELYKQTRSNESLIGEAKDKVGRAGKDSQEAAKKVNDILKDVEDIMRELENLPQLDDSDLQRLEEELIKAEQRVQEANLDKILEDLRVEHKKQNALVDAYKDEIERLRKEVENVREISEALPDKCFKRVELEP